MTLRASSKRTTPLAHIENVFFSWGNSFLYDPTYLLQGEHGQKIEAGTGFEVSADSAAEAVEAEKALSKARMSVQAQAEHDL